MCFKYKENRSIIVCLQKKTQVFKYHGIFLDRQCEQETIWTPGSEHVNNKVYTRTENVLAASMSLYHLIYMHRLI